MLRAEEGAPARRRHARRRGRPSRSRRRPPRSRSGARAGRCGRAPAPRSAWAGVSAREGRCGLAQQLVECDPRIGSPRERARARLDEGPNERPVLVGAARRAARAPRTRTAGRRPPRAPGRGRRTRRGRSRAGSGGCGARTAIRPAYSPAARLLPDSRGTSRRCGSRRPGRGNARACRSDGTAARRGDRPAALAVRWRASAGVPPRGRVAEHAVLDVAHALPGRRPDRPERLGHPHVPDPRHQALILQRLPSHRSPAPNTRATAARGRSRRRARPGRAGGDSASPRQYRPVPEHASSASPRARATAGRPSPARAVRSASAPSSADGSGRRGRPRSAAAGSCPPPRPTRARDRRPSRRPRSPARGCGDSTSSRWPTSGWSRSAAR